jgi:hypothetical protein
MTLVRRKPARSMASVAASEGKNDPTASSDSVERVALAQRHGELFGQTQHHLPARQGSSGFEEAEVARGDGRLAGEIELTEAPAVPPGTQKIADRLD